VRVDVTVAVRVSVAVAVLVIVFVRVNVLVGGTLVEVLVAVEDLVAEGVGDWVAVFVRV